MVCSALIGVKEEFYQKGLGQTIFCLIKPLMGNNYLENWYATLNPDTLCDNCAKTLDWTPCYGFLRSIELKGNIFYILWINCYNVHPATTKSHGASCQVPSSAKQLAAHLNYTHLLVCKLEGGGHICGPLSNNNPFCSIFCSSHTLGRDAQLKFPFLVKSLDMTTSYYHIFQLETIYV